MGEHRYRRYRDLHPPPALSRQLRALAGKFADDEDDLGGAGKSPATSRSVRQRDRELRPGERVSFSPSLTSFERLAVHRLAEELGLFHESTGVGLGRQLHVWRPPDTP